MMLPKFELVKATFNPKAVLTPAEREFRKTLAQFGGYVRQTDRNSIKERPHGESSLPGKPPFCHPGPKRFKDTIYFVVEMAQKTVFIGPIQLDGSGSGKAPKLIEEGGTGEIWVVEGGKLVKKMATFRPRPHLKPAFDAAIQKKLADLIKANLIKS